MWLYWLLGIAAALILFCWGLRSAQNAFVVLGREFLAKAQHWICPNCGKPLGAQERIRRLLVKTANRKGGESPVYILQCNECGHEMHVSRDGYILDDRQRKTNRLEGVEE